MNQAKCKIDGAWMPVDPKGVVHEHLGADNKMDAWRILIAKLGTLDISVHQLRARGYNVEYVVAT